MQLLVLDLGGGGEQLEERQHGPGAELDFGIDVVGQDARDVVDEPAAGDVGDALDLDFGADFADLRQVKSVGAQQFLAERRAQSAGARLEPAAELVEEDFAREREAVGVEAGGRQADDDVAGADRFCRR